MIDYIYRSVFAPYFKDFLHMKEVMGFRTSKIEYILKELDIFFLKEEVAIPTITKELIVRWRKGKSNETERTLYDKWSIISQFARYMCHLGYSCYVPRMPKRNFGEYIPFVFTHEQMQGIFETCDNLIMPYNSMTSKMFSIPALIRTLYSTGMRISEAISLKNKNVNMKDDIILIEKTKNQQQRLVPINPSLKAVLQQYVMYRNMMPLSKCTENEGFFFIAPDGSALNKGNAYNWFRKILKRYGIPHIGGNHGPRIHDLRHTCAVHSLMNMARNGTDIYCALPMLSIFLGHRTLTGTERYVRLTQEMYPDIIKMEESISGYVFPSISLIKRADEKE